MAIHYSNGFGKLLEKETERDVGDVRYLLIETDDTNVTSKKWWGEFSTKIKIDGIGLYKLEMEDGRKGDCAVTMHDEATTKRETLYRNHYRFYGRGKLT